MTPSDFFLATRWWFYIFIIGILFLPLTKSLFSRFFDRGYIFSKTLGIGIISYLIFILSLLHILPFQRFSIFILLFLFFLINVFLYSRKKFSLTIAEVKIYALMELFFFLSLLFWSYVKAFQPDIHGLEKFMDFGFMNSILRSSYLPPTDMWFPPHTINYYYFGHLVTAVLMKLSDISPFVSYNLMLSSIFAFTTTGAFSIASTLTNSVLRLKRTAIISGILGGILLSLGGNLHTIYAFFAPYTPPENPVPFWKLKLLISSFPNTYWYPNATRFIPYTIHEFPSYSFVVSDLHGHVLDIPFVLLTIALLYSLFLTKKLTIKLTLLISFLLAIMYMTNAWDGIIYFGLFSFSTLIINNYILKYKKNGSKKISPLFHFSRIQNKLPFLSNSLKHILIAASGYFIFALPFNLNFSPFVSGIGLICSPEFLTKIGKIGPFIFEAEHCQQSPLWMLFILYGFFYLFSITLIIKILKLKKISTSLIFVLLLFFFSTLLIIAPEFIYAKDIYPQHYRANTLFKLGYQAYIMLTLASTFSLAYILHSGKKLIWIPIAFILLSLNLSYSYFAISSYFGELKTYRGLEGISYLKELYPDDYDAILWIQKNIKGNPVILESQGDSYTDHGRISANTGLPTILGWTVHEWLWRGSYSIPQARLDDVRSFYEDDLEKTKKLIKKYNVKFAYIGSLERTKYPLLNEEKFSSLGKIIYQKGQVKIYQLRTN